MIVDCALYRGGQRTSVELEGALIAELAEMKARDGAESLGVEGDEASAGDRHPDAQTFVWVGLHDPSREEMTRVADALGLHPLAVDDALSIAQRPKAEPYPDHLFLVVKSLWYVEASDQVETGQVAFFVGNHYVITVRLGEGNDLAETRLNLEATSALLSPGPTAVVHAVVDRIVDEYERVAAELEKDVDEVEQSVFSEGRTRDSERIYLLKRELAEMRRAAAPLRQPMELCAKGAYDHIRPGSGDYFRDITDHLTRVTEVVDSLDNLLATALSAHLARISVEQNDDMRRISAWVALAAVSTLIAGVYGMNFDNMPELRWGLGYVWALGLMVGSSAVLYWRFKKSGWL